MGLYPYELERGSKKHTCPRCGAKKKFRRVIDTATRGYLPDHIGRCDRESNCGYAYTWKQYLADNPDIRNDTNARNRLRSRAIQKRHLGEPKESQSVRVAGLSSKGPDYLDLQHLAGTFTGYERNSFRAFLARLFPNDAESVLKVFKEYLIGTRDGFTVFPTIGRTGKICKAKLIKFDPLTGKRVKDGYSISSLESKLKKTGNLNDDFETNKDVFFGEHLCTKYPSRPIAIVESEKTAVIASICKGAFPTEYVWLGSHSKQWLKPDRIKRLGRDRAIILYPDADGFEKWQLVATGARAMGLNVKVSRVIEMLATEAEKADQVDLGDYLIREQSAINEHNGQEPGDLAIILQERVAIMIYDGGQKEVDATTTAKREIAIGWN